MKVLYVLRLLFVVGTYVTVALGLFASGIGDSPTLGPDGSLEMTHSSTGTVLGLAWLFVIGPLFVAFHTLAYRVVAELFVVLFRIFENTRDQLAITRAAATQEGPPSG